MAGVYQIAEKSKRDGTIIILPSQGEFVCPKSCFRWNCVIAETDFTVRGALGNLE
jgi:hypothetical protein